jgi:hypothetical protein
MLISVECRPVVQSAETMEAYGAARPVPATGHSYSAPRFWMVSSTVTAEEPDCSPIPLYWVKVRRIIPSQRRPVRVPQLAGQLRPGAPLR